jgi:hypothetical protein
MPNYPTAPRDMDGMWGIGVFVLPVVLPLGGVALAVGAIRARLTQRMLHAPN